MRISEVAKVTGLSVSNIRFYEKKGLLAPAREEESKYRDYSEEDMERLRRIILYRKMNVPVDTIYLLQGGQVSLETVLRRQEKELTEQKEMLEGSIALCRKILQEDDLTQLDVEYYLNYVHKEEADGKQFAEIDEMLEEWSEFSGMSRGLFYPMMGSPKWGGLAQNRWVIRGVSAAWLIICVMLPAAALWEKYREHGFVPMTAAVFWTTWFIVLGCSFVLFLRSRKNNR